MANGFEISLGGQLRCSWRAIRGHIDRIGMASSKDTEGSPFQ
jgi:hypothetical protein